MAIRVLTHIKMDCIEIHQEQVIVILLTFFKSITVTITELVFEIFKCNYSNNISDHSSLVNNNINNSILMTNRFKFGSTTTIVITISIFITIEKTIINSFNLDSLIEN